MSTSEICYKMATELVRLIRQKEVSVREVMEAHLSQVDRINPVVNAITTYHPEQALDQATKADEIISRGEPTGPLFGLPIAHKDLFLTKGVKTTYGSPIFKDFVPDEDALIVERLKRAGAISIGKTNVPEFGAGSQTFNPVFGATLNPYDTTRTCGGSSGGAGVALACGMLPIADGSDMGGSLRNPANFCNVVGLRPSAGRVPKWPSINVWGTLSVQGPMARTVQDAALMLSAIAGSDPRDPVSIAESGQIFRQPLERNFKEVHIAWSRDFGGLPIDPEVTQAIEMRRPIFEELGAVVEEAEPDFLEADEVFKTLRASTFAQGYGGLLAEYRDQMKDTVIWNIEAGLALTGPQVAEANVKRTTLYHQVRTFMERYEFMIFPVSQIPPFDVNQPYITEINGVEMETYIDWMKSCYYITAAGLPAISVPCGFTPQGLPVGVQIVGRHQDEMGVLQLAHAFEQATETWRNHPPMVQA